MRATEHAPRGPFHVLEHIHGLAEIIERGTGVHVERHRVKRPHPAKKRPRSMSEETVFSDRLVALDEAQREEPGKEVPRNIDA